MEKNTELLPLSHPNPVFLADVNYRLKGMFGKLFKLAKMKKAESECTKMDAGRLKRNVGLAVHANCETAESLNELKKNL